MVKLSDIKEVYNQQQITFSRDESLPRELLPMLPVDNTNHALVISGIRRCGKSTLLRQHIGQATDKAFYLNFDTPKLFRFDIHDFELLDSLIEETGRRKLYFDEIQVVEGWELYVRQKIDKGIILTLDQADKMHIEEGWVDIIPTYQFVQQLS